MNPSAKRNHVIPADTRLAKIEYEKLNPGSKFEALPTRKRNSLARDQMYHRQYLELSNAIMASGRRRRTIQ